MTCWNSMQARQLVFQQIINSQIWDQAISWVIIIFLQIFKVYRCAKLILDKRLSEKEWEAAYELKFTNF